MTFKVGDNVRFRGNVQKDYGAWVRTNLGGEAKKFIGIIVKIDPPRVKISYYNYLYNKIVDQWFNTINIEKAIIREEDLL